MPRPIVTRSELPGLTLLARGKVRDLYDLGLHLLLVATDRLSAFDVVLPTGIPDKGRVLTQLSAFWFRRFAGTVPHHMITADLRELPAELRAHADQLDGRAMLVRKVEVLPIECVARGYLIGSGWKDYRATGAVCGHRLPPGLRQAQRLPETLFTPATKAPTGHDENISFDEAARSAGRELMEQARALTLRCYEEGAAHAHARGIIIADTKFEFGLHGGVLTLCDEALTPDSSRFWPADEYRVGVSPPSFDKQYVRDYLETLDWNKTAPGPELPPEVQEGTRRRYLDAYRLLTGASLPD